MFKKEKIESSSVSNWVEPQLNKNKANTNNASDMVSESKTQFCHRSANESESDSEENRYTDVEESILEEKQLSHEKSIGLESQIKKVK